MAYANLSDLFKGICDAIRAKKGTAGSINHQDIPSEITSIETGADVSGVTASTSDVRSGKYYVNSSGILTQGTMPTKGSQYYTPTTYNQTISSGQYLDGTQTIYGDADLVENNIRYGKSIFGVTGKYKGAIKAVYLSDIAVTAYDIGAGFVVNIGEANIGDILYFVNIVKQSSASSGEMVSLSINATDKTALGWARTSSGTGRLSADSSDFTNGYISASIDVVADSGSSTGYSSQLNVSFLPDYGGDVTNGDKFTICAVWGSTTY